MIPASFAYVRATSLSDAIGHLQDMPDGAKLIAGGHSLLPFLKLRLAQPALLVDIHCIDELKGIEVGEQIRIGALTTHAQLLASEPLRKVLPIFHETANLIADPQVRNRGTIGGSLANADPAADWPAVVLALNAELEIAGAETRRRVAARDFFLDIMTTALDPQEILAAIIVARPKPGMQYRYRKIRHPASGYAVVGVAVCARIDNGIVSEISIGITGAAGRPFAADAASRGLLGKVLSRESIASAAALASEQADCLSDHYASASYRKNLVEVEVRRALLSLVEPERR